jgi:Rps23 Pro-64 3,4-dihydroxylase Tpa1-like proline 4-hydroxylase
MKIINNFLDINLIKKIEEYVNNNLQLHTWKTNLCWKDSIKKNSSQVSILNLTDVVEFSIPIKKLYNEIILETKSLKFSLCFYVWHNLSFIPFHKDGGYSIASTIYLNQTWEKDFGGLFLYEESNEIKAIVPKFNMCLINEVNINHGTSLIAINSPLRLTLQVFFK